jgi:hypothetical protein
LILISGALCLIALVLLIVGLVVSSGLTLIYASIAVSLVSFAFLFLGVRQRRPALTADAGLPGLPLGGRPPLFAGAGHAGAGSPSAPPAPQPVAVPEAQAPTAEPSGVGPVGSADDAATDRPAAVPAPAGKAPTRRTARAGQVYVVPGRPRYHLAGCRFLTGRQSEAMSPRQATESGYQPCAVCQAAVAQAPTQAPSAPSQAPPAPLTAAAAAAPPRQAPPAPPRGAAAAAAPSRAAVVVIPDRGRYHRPECRYVRGVAEAVEIPKAAARRQGYAPCGVCRP